MPLLKTAIWVLGLPTNGAPGPGPGEEKGAISAA
jgi:hypothetical protein